MIIPPRILQINILTVVPFQNWNGGDPNDPFDGFAYQWTVDFDVSQQATSYPLSSTPFAFSGGDVVEGDWFSDVVSGAALKIVTINSQSDGHLQVVAEDVDRFNTFTDPSGQGTGSCGIGTGFLYQLGDDGIPVIGPLSPVYTALNANLAWQLDQISRFRYRNLLASYYRVQQASHGFSIGDVIHLNPDGSYAAVTPNTASIVASVGPVSSVGIPGPDWFSYRPNGRVVNNLSPALPGVPGELIYVGPSGLSNVAPSRWSSPLYIQLADPTSGIALNRGADTAGTFGYTNRTYVVADQPTANALLTTVNLGDQIMIDNAGYGEWTHTLVHQGTLRPISTQDSARVDAETLEVTITPTTLLQNVSVNGVTMTGLLMGNVSANRSVALINVQVTTAFTANAVVSVGTSTVADLLMSNALIDLTVLGSYAYSPTVDFSAGYTSLYSFINYNGSATGNAVVTVSYV